jgi:3D (Asp-Asp-Asp) domain-containing protein
VTLQNLDYSIPPEDDLLPGSTQIEVVRVNEALNIATEAFPYESIYELDPETPLDQYSVIEPGQDAIFATRERVLYENGEETWRTPAENWKASEAREGVVGYGTKAVIQTEVVDGQTIEYWRKLSVYATSYKPCDANGVCHDGTAGGYPLQQGIIAVSPKWYSVPNGLAMADLRVYVPGYGYAIIGDVCGGCSGEYWIDLAYREENYIPWYHWTTMYFLTPVPAYYPAIITP